MREVITLLVGENSFEVERALQVLTADFAGDRESFDGTELSRSSLPDLLMGTSLFAVKRLVVIKGLSEQALLWTELEQWLPRASDDIHLVLVEPKPDKRTRTYKALQKIADVREYKPWGERDVAQAEQWVKREAEKLGRTLDATFARRLVQRVGVDQWALYNALQKLIVLDDITLATIDDHIEPSPSENVFNVLEAALKGDGVRLQQMIRTLELTEDPYRLFGLLGGQVFQLAALIVTDRSSANVAKDLGAHPFALSKLASFAKKLHKTEVKKMITAFAEADQAMKSSGGDPWLLVERALMKVALIASHQK